MKLLFHLDHHDQKPWGEEVELGINKDRLLSTSPMTILPWLPFLVAKPK